MALLNYTTTIDVHQTLAEIQKILVAHGARKIMHDYDNNGHIQELCFQISTASGDRGIKLPANIPAIYEVLKQQKKAGKIKANCNYEQAERVGWRIIKDWIEAQMAMLETQMVQMDEIFMPYMVYRNGQTYFEAYQGNLLLAGD